MARKKLFFTEAQEENIVQLYKNGTSKREIIKRFSCITDRQVTRILKKHNIKIRRNKYNVDEHIFDVIDTVDKAYWLGFIVGDGYINEKRGFLSIKLSMRDESHLIKFADFIGASRDVVKHGKGNYDNDITYMYVSSKLLVKSLVDKNITQAKSGKEHVPIDIPYKLIKDYLRGLIDADGCIQTGKHLRLDLSNSMENIEFMQNYLVQALSINPGRIYDHQGTYRVYYAGLQRIYSILKHLYYADDITYLDRKYEQAKMIFDDYKRKSTK